jgi:hypothetical protein
MFMGSMDGVDVYSATPWNELRYVDPTLQDGMKVILVYQDEGVRQRKISSLRESVRLGDWLVPLRHAPLANLKFSVVHFEWTAMWVHDVLTRKWLVADVEYFEPEACIPLSPKPEHWQLPEYTKPNLQADSSYLNCISGIIFPENRRPSPDDDPVLAKTIRVLQTVLKKYRIQD